MRKNPSGSLMLNVSSTLDHYTVPLILHEIHFKIDFKIFIDFFSYLLTDQPQKLYAQAISKTVKVFQIFLDSILKVCMFWVSFLTRNHYFKKKKTSSKD